MLLVTASHHVAYSLQVCCSRRLIHRLQNLRSLPTVEQLIMLVASCCSLYMMYQEYAVQVRNVIAAVYNVHRAKTRSLSKHSMQQESGPVGSMKCL